MAFTTDAGQEGRAVNQTKLLYVTDAGGTGGSVLGNASLVAAANVNPVDAGFLALLTATYASAAAARNAISEGGECNLYVTPRDGSSVWTADIGVSGGLATLVVVASAGAVPAISSAIVTLEFRHTGTR